MTDREGEVASWTFRLQWGHGFEAVGDVTYPLIDGAKPELQWGHGFEAVGDFPSV